MTKPPTQLKKIITIVGFLVQISAGFGQGTLIFANLASGVNAPVTFLIGGARVTNTNFLADLYFSTNTNAPTNSLQAASFNVAFSTTTAGGGGGYFLGGSRTVIGAIDFIEAQVRVWDSRFGATYSAANAAGGCVGQSAPVIITLALVPSFPPPLVGLQAFTVCLPEPATLSLAGLGFLALLVRARARYHG